MTPRRRRESKRRELVTEAERLWALDKLGDWHPDGPAVWFFTPPARLREVWRVVHGEELDARPGAIVHGAIV